MKKRTKYYIYTRVSTAVQVDGYSPDAQREKLRKKPLRKYRKGAQQGQENEVLL